MRRLAAAAPGEVGNRGQRRRRRAEAASSWRYVTGPMPGVRTSLRRSEVFDPTAWLGSFRQAKDIFAMLPEDEQRETEQQGEQRMDEWPP